MAKTVQEIQNRLSNIRQNIAVWQRKSAGPQVLTKQQALEQGYNVSSLPDDSMVKLTPDASGNYQFSYITPDNWEYSFDASGNLKQVTGAEDESGQRKTYTADEYNQLAEDSNKYKLMKENPSYYNEGSGYNIQAAIDAGVITPEEAGRMFGETWQTDISIRLQPYYDAEAGGFNVQAALQQGAITPQEFQDNFPGIKPNFNSEQGTLDYYNYQVEQQVINQAEYDKIEGLFADVYSESDVENSINLMQNEPDIWIAGIQEKGRTDETVNLLTGLGFTPDEIDYIFDPEGYLSNLAAGGYSNENAIKLLAINPNLTEDQINNFFANGKLASETKAEVPESPDEAVPTRGGGSSGWDGQLFKETGAFSNRTVSGLYSTNNDASLQAATEILQNQSLYSKDIIEKAKKIAGENVTDTGESIKLPEQAKVRTTLAYGGAAGEVQATDFQKQIEERVPGFMKFVIPSGEEYLKDPSVMNQLKVIGETALLLIPATFATEIRAELKLMEESGKATFLAKVGQASLKPFATAESVLNDTMAFLGKTGKKLITEETGAIGKGGKENIPRARELFDKLEAMTDEQKLARFESSSSGISNLTDKQKIDWNYREIFSTGTKNPLKKGETWQSRANTYVDKYYPVETPQAGEQIAKEVPKVETPVFKGEVIPSDIEGYVFSGSGEDVSSNWFSGSIDKALDFSKARLKSGRGGNPVIKVFKVSDIENRTGTSLREQLEGGVTGKLIPSSEYSYINLNDVPSIKVGLTKGFKTAKEDILNAVKKETITPKVETPKTLDELAKTQPEIKVQVDEAVKNIVDSPEVSAGLTPEEKTVVENIVKEGFEPPKPPEPPLKSTSYGFTPPNKQAVVDEFRDVLRQAKKLSPEERAKAELLRHSEKAQRVAIAYGRLKTGEGKAAFIKARTALGGRYSYPVFEAPSSIMDEGKIKQLYDIINDATKSGKIQLFEGSDTHEALTKLLEGEMPTAREIGLLEDMFGADVAKAILSHRTTWEKFQAEVLGILNIPRTLKASIDVSAPFRQGIVLSMGQPKEFWPSFGRMFKTIFSEKNALQLDEVIKSNRFYQKMQDAGLYIAPFKSKVSTAATEFEEAYMTKWAEKIPGVRQSERAYVSFLNKLRSDTFYSYCKQWERLGYDAKAYKDLAAFINSATGRGPLPRSLTGTGSLLNAAFFSPRFAASRINLLTTPFTVWTKSPPVRKVMVKNLLSFVATGMGVLAILKFSGVADVEVDSTSADFGKIKVGNTRWDFWGGFQQWARFTAQIITAKRKSTSSGVTSDVNRGELALNLIRSKESPIFGLGWDLIKGETYEGQPIAETSIGQQAKDLLLPMVIQDIWEGIEDRGIIGGLMAVPSAVGFGVQTYGGDYWSENELALGTPISEETLPYSLTGKIYQTNNYYSDTMEQIKDMPVSEMTDQFGYPDKVKAVAEARDIKKSLEFIPNVSLKSINADPTKGDTYEQYYTQWQERSKITDEKKLAEFDKNYPNAKLGNMTFRQYDLLRQYNSLKTDKDKKAFLKDNPEINLDPYDEYLKSHPLENAKLALWGQAKILTPEAYAEYQKLAVELDIPDSALPDTGLPDNQEDVETYFEYKDLVGKYGYDDPEVEKMILDNPSLAEFTGREIDTPAEILDLKIKNRDLDAQYSDLTTEVERTNFEKQHPDWQADNWRVDAYNEQYNYDGTIADKSNVEQYVKYKQTPEAEQELFRFQDVEFYNWGVKTLGWKEYTGLTQKIADSHVDYSNLPDNDLERKLYRLENPDYEKWALDNGIFTTPAEAKSIDALKLKIENQDDAEAYGKLLTDAERQQYKIDHPEYEKNLDLIKAYEAGADTAMANKYADYAKLETTYEQDLARLQDKKLDEWGQKALGWNPLEETNENLLKLQIKNADKIAAYNKLNRTQQKAMLANDTEFAADKWRIAGYKAGVPDKSIEDYVTFMTMTKDGYYRENWLRENQDFYNDVYLGVLGYNELDFTKIPSDKVNKLIDTYNAISYPLDKAKQKNLRLALRQKYPELDWWLVMKRGYSPIREVQWYQSQAGVS